MKGHGALIAMRHSGVRPETVSIHLGADHSNAWRDWHETTPKHAHVEIADDEPLSGLDMRFTVGMFVVITGSDEKRISSVHAACQASGAQRVLSGAVYFDPSKPNADGAVGLVLDSKSEAL